MRGKDLLVGRQLAAFGITPAYAGKSCTGINYVVQERDHPRVCGEKLYWHQLRCTGAGSPPRMRGKDADPHTKLRRYGITPAYAGKRAWFSYCGCQDRDHPRVCGEKALSTFSSRKNSGSPPRMRGKEPDTIITELTDGITPAYAGKRVPRVYGPSVPGDHPRVCGEKAVCWPLVWIIWGSPPRVRGKAVAIFRQLHHGRITPAYAGKSDILLTV